MQIHQITDLHIPDTPERGDFAHVKNNILRQFAFINLQKPDLLVITGDLTMSDASESACLWLRDHLPGVPIRIIPGNHDDPDLIWQIFGPTYCPNPQFFGEEVFGEEFFGKEPYPNCRVVYLNTTSEQLPENQLNFLEHLQTTSPTLLFLHHPPCLIGEGFMSRTQPLQNHQAAASAISASGIRHVFCGHFHNRAEVNCDDFTVHLTPSPAFQISLDNPDYEMQDFQPMVRVFQINSDTISTRLVTV